MAKVRVVLDQPALREWLAGNGGAQAELLGTAEKFKDAAEQASPVGKSRHWGPFVGIHGYFKRRWRVRPFRGGYRVYNADPFAHLVEYGSVRNPAYAPFRRTLRRFDGKLNPKGSTGAGRP